jgi:hypothetical protein
MSRRTCVRTMPSSLRGSFALSRAPKASLHFVVVPLGAVTWPMRDPKLIEVEGLTAECPLLRKLEGMFEMYTLLAWPARFLLGTTGVRRFFIVCFFWAYFLLGGA